MAAQLHRWGWLLILTGVACSATLIFLPGGVMALALGIVCLLVAVAVGHLDHSSRQSTLTVVRAAPARTPVPAPIGTVAFRVNLHP